MSMTVLMSVRLYFIRPKKEDKLSMRKTYVVVDIAANCMISIRRNTKIL